MPPSTASAGSSNRLRALVAGIAALGLGAALLSPMLTYPFGSDHGSFSAVADVIARGGVPYRDVWEIKPPGVYYLFWATFAGFGRSMFSIRLMDLLWALATAAALFAIGRRLSNALVGWASAFFFVAFYALNFDFWHTAQADGFGSFLPLALAFLLALIAEERGSKWLALSSGLLIGVAIVFKFTLGAFLAVPLAMALSARQPWSARVARATSYIVGGLAVPAAAALLMWKAGALRDMLYIVFTWNSNYGRIQPAGPKLQVISGQIARFHLGGAFLILQLIGLLCIGGIADAVLRRRSLRLWWAVPSWWAVMLGSVCVQGKYFAYHWLPVLPALALLAAGGLSAVVRWAGEERRKLVTAVVVGVLAVCFVHAYLAHFDRPIAYASGGVSTEEYLSSFTASGDYFSFLWDVRAADYLRSHSDADETIFIWGLEPLVYFLADRPLASRFIHDVPLLTPWSPPEWRQELIRDLARNRPKFIVVVHYDAQPWVTRWGLDSASALPYYPELARLRDERYRFSAQIEHFEVWERK